MDVLEDNAKCSIESTSSTSLEKGTTCSGCSRLIISSSGSKDTIIELTQNDSSSWDSDEVEQDSDTSTPNFKRGCHGTALEGISEQEAVKAILKEGVSFTTSAWVQRRPTRSSVVILADSQLKYWPKDWMCEVHYHKWPLKRWNQAIRMGVIRVECHTVVLYLEASRRWQYIPPIKNSLQTLCRPLKLTVRTPEFSSVTTFLA